MNTTSQHNADIAISFQNKSFTPIRDIELFFKIGTCDKAKRIVEDATEIRNLIEEVTDKIGSLKLKIKKDFNHIEWAIEDADHERC